MATFAFSSAKVRARYRPMPLAPPVTMTTFPSSMAISLLIGPIRCLFHLGIKRYLGLKRFDIIVVTLIDAFLAPAVTLIGSLFFLSVGEQSGFHHGGGELWEKSWLCCMAWSVI
jgi:hypothetical protein